ncbi:MAG: carboxymuconolactone decarboxylase family protein [Acidobacteriota bacterium]|nr:carboxymuconolactone decarboxylase family protein [Acidobacteriota bacterium]
MTRETDIPQAWVSLPARSELPDMTGGPYDFGFVPNMGRLLLTHRRIGAAFRDLYNEVMFAEGKLDRREREMIAAVAAAAQDCYY